MSIMKMRNHFDSQISRCFILISSLLSCTDLSHAAAPSAALGFQAEISMMGESALIDKETGRVFWEGGSSNTLFESVEPKLKGHIGIDHFKATLLSGLLLLIIIGQLSSVLRDKLLQLAIQEIPGLPFRITVLYHFLVKTVLFVPQFDRWFVLGIIFLYLVEAYTCNTRRYLANKVGSPDDVESFLETLRKGEPLVEWKVRCFHYETPPWLAPLESVCEFLKRNLFKKSATAEILEKYTSSPSIFRRKALTNISKGSYQFKDCKDKTIAAIWKRARVGSGDPPLASLSKAWKRGDEFITKTSAAPFTKIIVGKNLVLANAKTREDYFQQQSDFVKEHGQCDDYAEFSTSILVAGFRPRVLAVKSTSGYAFARLFRSSYYFWLFTLLGLTVPYRRLFSSHCDELRVTVIKETYAEEQVKESISKRWFPSITSMPSRTDSADTGEQYTSVMQNLMLYSKKKLRLEPQETEEATALLQEGVEAATIMAELSMDEKIENQNVTSSVENKASMNETVPTADNPIVSTNGTLKES